VICGEVEIGENTHIGAGSVIKQQVKIGSNTIIGMGSIVLKDIKGNVVAYGNPCKEVKSL
jgi:acetyltransferase-like isoleucine patch superfamily enzyme